MRAEPNSVRTRAGASSALSPRNPVRAEPGAPLGIPVDLDDGVIDVDQREHDGPGPLQPPHPAGQRVRHRDATTVLFEGNLADDPQVRFTGSGKQITEITVLVNQRRHNNDGEWFEVEPTRHVVRAFKTLAENIAESLAKGDRVFVQGTVTTEARTDKQTGDKRTAQRVLAEIVGPSLRWATARITKTTRTSRPDGVSAGRASLNPLVRSVWRRTTDKPAQRSSPR